MQLVAVYGTLKEHQGNHSVMVHSKGELVGTTKTAPKYTMYEGGFPRVVEGGDCPITVEVYSVDDLSMLDRLEGHPSHFKRELVDVEDMSEQAWMYIYQHPVPHGTVVPSGNWRSDY